MQNLKRDLNNFFLNNKTIKFELFQAELGDYDETIHTVEYFREFYLFPESLVHEPDESKQFQKLDLLIQARF